jgi:hypothetical protein
VHFSCYCDARRCACDWFARGEQGHARGVVEITCGDAASLYGRGAFHFVLAAATRGTGGSLCPLINIGLDLASVLDETTLTLEMELCCLQKLRHQGMYLRCRGRLCGDLRALRHTPGTSGPLVRRCEFLLKEKSHKRQFGGPVEILGD